MAPKQASISSYFDKSVEAGPSSGWTAINGPGMMEANRDHTESVDDDVERSAEESDIDDDDEEDSSQASPSKSARDLPAMTDDEIFALPITELKNRRVLQIAKSHTNKEIIEKWNSLHPNSEKQLHDRNMAQMISRALIRVAKIETVKGTMLKPEWDEAWQQRREELKSQFREAREQSGVITRMNATTGRSNWKSSPEKRKRAAEDDDDDVENESVVEAEPAEDPESRAKREQKAEALATLKAECESLITGGLNDLRGRNLLKVAQVFFPSEIVRKINAHNGADRINERSLGNRMRAAYGAVALSDGKEVQEVKDELAAKKVEYGTKKRFTDFTTERRVATFKANKKQRVEAEAVCGNQVDDNEDPIGDLNEIDRREREGNPILIDSPELPTNPSMGLLPKVQESYPEFAPSTGYLTGQSGYVPGFRRYRDDGTQITDFETNSPAIQEAYDRRVAEDVEEGERRASV